MHMPVGDLVFRVIDFFPIITLLGLITAAAACQSVAKYISSYIRHQCNRERQTLEYIIVMGQ